MVLLFYTTFISADIARHEILRAKVGKGGIMQHNETLCKALEVLS